MPRIGVIHPDLGIGGAERLVVDMALAFKELDYDVTFFTSHHDTSHSFPEANSFKIFVIGDWFPRCLFGSYFHMFCSLIRSFLVTMYVLLFGGDFDIFVVDQVSAFVPLLKCKAPVLFYCHFPDQLLAPHHTWLRKIYRLPLNLLEEWTMRYSNKILTNSQFTKTVLLETFKSLSNCQIDVLYPCVHVPTTPLPELKNEDMFTFLSINRFERKKNLELAIESLGGYDCRVTENVQYFQYLKNMAEPFGACIKLMRSISESEKFELLQSSTAVLYTPANEHFGIVPIEAMAYGVPIIAVNSGGPKETIIDGETGFLCAQSPEEFARAMKILVESADIRKRMAYCARQHVKEKFSFEQFTKHLQFYAQTVNEKIKNL